MPRHQLHQTWTAPLPTGKTVKGVVPDCRDTRRALELVADQHLADAVVAEQAAVPNLLRLTIKEIDGRKMAYEDLRHGKLDRRLNPKEQGLLRRMLETMRKPTNRALEWAEDHQGLAVVDGDQYWTTSLLHGDNLERVNDLEGELDKAHVDAEFFGDELDALDDRTAEEVAEHFDGDTPEEARAKLERQRDQLDERIDRLVDQLEEAKEAAVPVRGMMPSSKRIRRATEQVSARFKKHEATLQKEASENILRNCITSIAGEEVNYQTLYGDDGEGLDKWLSIKEQNLALHVIMSVSTPSEEEEEDFLEGVTIG